MKKEPTAMDQPSQDQSDKEMNQILTFRADGKDQDEPLKEATETEIPETQKVQPIVKMIKKSNKQSGMRNQILTLPKTSIQVGT